MFPGTVMSFPEKVIGEFVKVFDVPDPAQPVTVPPVPDPSNTEELSIFSQASVAPCSINTAQSPVTQSVMPSRFVEPSTDTM